MSEKLYRVCWRSRLTGATGQGDPSPRMVAEKWAEEGNRKHPNIEHWVERA